LPSPLRGEGKGEGGKNSLAAECSYLAGWAHLGKQDLPSAARALQVPAKIAESPSAQHARALLGKIHVQQEQTAEAIQWWQALDAKKRTAWNLSQALAGT